MTAARRNGAFRPFSWLSKDIQNDHAAIFAARVKDLSDGMHLCLQMIEGSTMAREQAEGDEDVALLGVCDTSILLRMTITAAHIIGEQAAEFYERVQERHDEAHATLANGAGHE